MQLAVLPVFLFVAAVAGVCGALLLISRLLNPHRVDRVKEMPYESGMDPVHDTRRRFSVRFHLVAIAFLVFEVELLFLYPWAVALRPAPAHAAAGGSLATGAAPAAKRGFDYAVANGWVESRGLVFAGVMVFIVVLVLGFVYDWRKGVFRWQ